MEPIDIEGVRASAAGRRLTERPPLADDVHDVLVDMLMNHTLAPGTRLNIEVLAKTLGVSPTPVREALARVEAGTYGTCRVCGQPIGRERLEAIPGATTCITCQAR